MTAEQKYQQLRKSVADLTKKLETRDQSDYTVLAYLNEHRLLLEAMAIEKAVRARFEAISELNIILNEFKE